MPNELTQRAFAENDLALVQDFECGTSDWAVSGSLWLRTKSLEAMRRGNRIWLYFDENELVGFGSLGKTTWPVPPPRREYAYIPQLAIATAFQGGPPGVDSENKYSRQIMRHLITEALQFGPDELALRVHKENKGAINLYNRFDFHQLPHRERDED